MKLNAIRIEQIFQDLATKSHEMNLPFVDPELGVVDDPLNFKKISRFGNQIRKQREQRIS